MRNEERTMLEESREKAEEFESEGARNVTTIPAELAVAVAGNPKVHFHIPHVLR